MSRVSNEPTFMPDGRINPFFQPDPSYVPFVQVIPWKDAPRQLHEHYFEFDDSKEEAGTPVSCVVCRKGKILAPDATLIDGKIVSRNR